MLTAVKNQLRVTLLSVKYAFMRELLNRFTFVTNVLFMVLNNSFMIVQWIILFSLKDNIGNYSFKQVLLLWALFAGTYGISHFFFKNAFDLPKIINQGLLDQVIVQPKNVLISIITIDVDVAALGDIIFAYIIFFVHGATLTSFLLFTFLAISGALIVVAFAVILGSLSFWFGKSDVLVDSSINVLNLLSQYPEGIFNPVIKIVFYTLIPLGFVVYLPVDIMNVFNVYIFIAIVAYLILMISLAFIVFNLGLKKYSSTNLMNVRV